MSQNNNVEIEIGSLLDRWSYRTDDVTIICGFCNEHVLVGENLSYVCDVNRRRWYNIWICERCYRKSLVYKYNLQTFDNRHLFKSEHTFEWEIDMITSDIGVIKGERKYWDAIQP